MYIYGDHSEIKDIIYSAYMCLLCITYIVYIYIYVYNCFVFTQINIHIYVYIYVCVCIICIHFKQHSKYTIYTMESNRATNPIQE